MLRAVRYLHAGRSYERHPVEEFWQENDCKRLEKLEVLLDDAAEDAENLAPHDPAGSIAANNRMEILLMAQYLMERDKMVNAAKAYEREHSLPPTDFVSPAKFKRLMMQKSEQLWDLWEKLQSIYLRHGHTLEIKWKKKTPAQRKALLLKVNPEIPLSQSTDIEIYTSQRPDMSHRVVGGDLLVSYVNVETLMSPASNLNNLMRVRSLFDPSEFAYFDYERTRVAFRFVTYTNVFAVGEDMCMYGPRGTYGSVIHRYPLSESVQRWAPVFETERGRKALGSHGDELLELAKEFSKRSPPERTQLPEAASDSNSQETFPYPEGEGDKLIADRAEYADSPGKHFSARGDSVPGAYGLKVLEAQTYLIEFLLGVAQELLPDPPLTTEGLPLPPRELRPMRDAILHSKDPLDWASAGRRYAMQPFQPPPKFNLQYMLRIAYANFEAAQDHVWLLRTDPTYFYHAIKDYSDHRPQHVLDYKGQKHPALYGWDLWEPFLVSGIVTESYRNVAIWHTILKGILSLGEELDKAQKLNEPVGSGMPLPENVAKSMLSLEYLLWEASEMMSSVLSRDCRGSPPLRKDHVALIDYYNSKVLATDSYPITLQRRLWNQDLVKTDKLLWILRQMPSEMADFNMPSRRDDHATFVTGRLLEELDSLVQQDPRQARRITPRIASKMSDLAAVNELSEILAYHRPQAVLPPEGAESEERAGFEELLRIFDVLAIHVPQDLKTITQSRSDQEGSAAIASMVFPLGDLIHPTGSSGQDVNWIQKVRQSEEKLEAIWNQIDSFALSRGGKTLHEAMAGIISPRSRPTIQERQPTAAAPKSNVHTASTEDTDSSPVIKGPKTKTRGIPTLQPQPPDTHDTAPQQPEPPRTVALNHPLSNRAKKVFNALFPTRDNQQQGAQAGTVAWADFVTAMTSLGFAALKQSGSSWLFTNEDHSFIEHAPHPEPKLSFYRVRAIGRRLKRRFGWTSDMFKE